MPQGPERAGAGLLGIAPHVIAGEADVLPAQRRDEAEQVFFRIADDVVVPVRIDVARRSSSSQCAVMWPVSITPPCSTSCRQKNFTGCARAKPNRLIIRALSWALFIMC